VTDFSLVLLLLLYFCSLRIKLIYIFLNARSYTDCNTVCDSWHSCYTQPVRNTGCFYVYES